MKLALVLLIVVLLVPTASATVTITPKPGTDGFWTGAGTFGDKTSETYLFANVLPSSAFNLSATPGANDSVVFTTTGEFAYGPFGDDRPTIDASTSYQIDTTWNATETLTARFDYIKKGWGYFAVWEAHYTITYNGQQLCSTDDVGGIGSGLFNLAGNTIRPAPAFAVSITQKRINGSPEMVLYSIRDGIAAFAYSPICENPNTGGQYVNGTHLTTMPLVTVTAFDGKTYQHFIRGTFGNATMLGARNTNWTGMVNNLAAATFGVDAPGCEGIFGLGACFVSGLILGLLDIVEMFFSFLFEFLFRIIPFGKQLKDILLFPIDVGFRVITWVSKFYLASGSNYPIGGTYYALIILSISFGSAIAALLGNLTYVWRVPYYFLVATTLGVFLAFRFIYWEIPKFFVETAVSLIRAVRG